MRIQKHGGTKKRTSKATKLTRSLPQERWRDDPESYRNEEDKNLPKRVNTNLGTANENVKLDLSKINKQLKEESKRARYSNKLPTKLEMKRNNH